MVRYFAVDSCKASISFWSIGPDFTFSSKSTITSDSVAESGCDVRTKFYFLLVKSFINFHQLNQIKKIVEALLGSKVFRQNGFVRIVKQRFNRRLRKPMPFTNID
jgi:hypothetical protein